jgi:hypothetical protein
MAPSITKGIAPGDDSDLEDLIAKPHRSRTSVEIDSAVSSPLGFSLCCGRFPDFPNARLILVVLGFVGYLSNTLFNPTKTMGIMGAYYSAIKDYVDLSLSKVDHWCIRGDNESCRCEDPLEAAIPRAGSFKVWTAAHNANVAAVSMYRAIYCSAPTKIYVASGKPRLQSMWHFWERESWRRWAADGWGRRSFALQVKKRDRRGRNRIPVRFLRGSFGRKKVGPWRE